MTASKIIALFPGQGSQKVGMGKDFFEHSQEAKDLYKEADKILDFSISDLSFEGPAEELTLTDKVQPAILIHSVVCLRQYLRNHPEAEIVAAAGHSLGEYTALVSAGVINFTDAVSLVHFRGKFMQSAVPVGSGKMCAVLGKTPEEIGDLIKDYSQIWIANLNAPGQIVLSGSATAMEKFATEQTQLKLIMLPVSVPSHCALMEPAKVQLSELLDETEFSPAEFPVYCNTTASPTTEPALLKAALKQQIIGQVRWTTSVEQIISNYPGTPFVEFGPGNILTGLLKRIDRQAEKSNVNSYSAV